jgi:putative ABC transport system permease protein
MNSSGVAIAIPGQVPANSRDGRTFPVLSNVVDDGYFAVTHIPIVAGRGFQRSDDERAARVVIVNETLAAEYWPGKTALGQTIEMDSVPMTVVGVVKNAKYNKLNEGITPFMYLPYAQHWQSEINVLVRTSGNEHQLAPAIRRELRSLDANLPVPTVTTLKQATAVVLLPQRVAVLVTGVLGFAGLMLAGIGLYGVISFSTAQRTREIGVRVALGAARGDVLRMVVGEGMVLVGIGMAVGLVLAVAATRALTSFLFGVSPLDFVTFVLTAAILAATALLASYLPARRAATVDPMLALRQE